MPIVIAPSRECTSRQDRGGYWQWVDPVPSIDALPRVLGSRGSSQLPSNNLQGTFPDELSGLSCLTFLELSSNPGIVGTLPVQQLGTLPALGYMYDVSSRACVFAFHRSPMPLSRRLIGSSAHCCSRHTTSNVGSCGLTGSIPPSISSLTSMQFLYDAR